LDARHFSPAELDAGLPEGADPDGVSLVYLVSAFPGAERERANSLANLVRATFPFAHVIRVFCPGVAAAPDMGGTVDNSALLARSLTQAMEMYAVPAEKPVVVTRTAIPT